MDMVMRLFLLLLMAINLSPLLAQNAKRQELMVQPTDKHLSQVIQKGRGNDFPKNYVQVRQTTTSKERFLPVSVPEGLVTENYTLRAWHYRYNESGWAKYSRGKYQDNDEVLCVKVGFDGKDVYIQGFFDRFIPETWVKGTMSEDETTITFNTQYYGTDGNGYDHYFFGYIGEQNSSGRLLPGDVVFQYDKATSTFRLSPSTEVADSEYGDIWQSWDYYDYIVITKGYQEQETTVIPPDGLHVEDYSFSALVVTYDNNGNPIEVPTTFGVKIGFNGNDVYIKGLCQLLPDSWVKGTIADGKLTISNSPYMGEAASLEVFLTAMPINATDWMQLEDIVFNYDSETKVFSGGTEQFLLINASKVRIYYFTEYLNINISRLAEQSVKPEAPQIIEFSTYNNSNGYGFFRFDIPLTDVYGNGLLEDKLYYQILVDDEHVISDYVFSKDQYETLSDNLSFIPYSYSDGKYFDLRFNYETRISDKVVFITENEPFSKNRIGIRSVYYGGGIENASDTVWCFLREFADVIAFQEALAELSDEIDLATQLLNDETRARGKDDLQAAITVATSILQSVKSPDEIIVVRESIESLKEAEEAYITLNLMIDPEEWAILQIFYQNTNSGEGWKQTWDFTSNIPSVAKLPGVTAYNGHVTGIDVSGNNIHGSFPFIVFSLPQLKNLNLSDNLFSGDIGTTMAAYVEINSSTQIAIENLNISGNQFTGNIGLFAACCPNLKELNASDNCLEEVSPIISSTVTNVNLGNQNIDKTIEVNLGNLSSEYLISQVPNILLYNHAGQTYSSDIRLLCATSDETWSMRLINQNGQISFSAVSENNAFHGQSGDTLKVAVLKSNNAREGSTFRIKLSFDEGDGNFDGQVNVLDLQTTLNYMFEDYTNKPYNFTASNLWKDEVINVQDAVCMVNRLLEEEPATARAMGSRKAAGQSTDNVAALSVENGKLILHSPVPVSAFDIIVASGLECVASSELADLGFTCAIKQTGSQTHIVGYSLGGTTLPAGKNALCNMEDGVITYAMLADSEAEEITVSTSGTTTIVHTSKFNVQSSELYRLSLGTKRAIVIDKTGKKTMVKDEK